MAVINQIGIIRAKEAISKIEDLFSKAGFKVVLKETGYTKELSDTYYGFF